MLKLVLASSALVASAKHLSNDEIIAMYGRRVHTGPVQLRTPKDASQTLRQAAVSKGIYMGAEIRYPSLTNFSDTQYNVTAAAQYNLVTAENECKWAATQPEENQYTLQQCAVIAEFAAANGMVHRLHNLAWGGYNPSWLINPPKPWSPTDLNTTMTSHATKLVQAFNPSTSAPYPAFCTDTVNEAISDDNGPDVFKPVDPWYPALPDYVATQFYAARAADPTGGQMKLFYNEYGAEGLGVKSDKVYNMVKGFLARGVPIDGVGLQMHLSVDGYPSPADVSTNMARLVALGMEVHVTEMDVKCSNCNSDRLQIQAKIYGDILQACLNNTKPTAPNGKGGCKSFETWGFTDRFTWVEPANVPLPFDFNYQPKPAFYEMLAVLQA